MEKSILVCRATTALSAVVSHLLHGPKAKTVAPAVFLALLLTSFALRPANGD